ncbi:MAG TPA: GNAT family N-acetyltransferase [Gammaproteobacteria bacterium]|nr:GNAT family N-acetyltransferase [Gammaproteobacteria bacterium]
MDVEIEQATLEQLAIVAAILQEAAAWAERAHERLWVEAELAPDAIRREVEQGQFFLARSGRDPVGTLRYQIEDRLFWPDARGDDAAYVHRLAVRRCYAGRGVAAAMLRWAAARARAEGRRYLRLDTDITRPGLRALYEGCGFVPHSERQVGPYRVMRYQLELGGGTDERPGVVPTRSARVRRGRQSITRGGTR